MRGVKYIEYHATSSPESRYHEKSKVY